MYGQAAPCFARSAFFNSIGQASIFHKTCSIKSRASAMQVRIALACIQSRTRSESASGMRHDIYIREAEHSDARALAKLVSHAFNHSNKYEGTDEQEKNGVLIKLKSTLEFLDLLAQLDRRLSARRKQSRMQSANGQTPAVRKHVVLVAHCKCNAMGNKSERDGNDKRYEYGPSAHNQEIAGCVEMGVVDRGTLERGETPISASDWGASGKRDSAKSLAACAYIGNLAVAPEMRRKGVATALVREAERVALEKWNLKNVCLHVDAQNQGAREMYARLGYQCKMKEPAWYVNVGRAQRMFLTSGYEAGDQSVFDKAPERHAKKLGMLEYLLWCVWDLRQGSSRRERAQRAVQSNEGRE